MSEDARPGSCTARPGASLRTRERFLTQILKSSFRSNMTMLRMVSIKQSGRLRKLRSRLFLVPTPADLTVTIAPAVQAIGSVRVNSVRPSWEATAITPSFFSARPLAMASPSP